MNKQSIFTGAGVAIVTPMNADGSVNYAKFRELIDWQIDKGTDALVACGTTGESSTLTNDEHIAVIKAAVEQAAGRVPVLAGTGSNDTAYAVELSLEAKALGVDALLMVTPYYNKTSQRGLVAHYNLVANEAKMPIVLYNVPSRTGVDIKPATVAELAKNPYITAIKQANGSISDVAEIASLCDIDIYSGNDDQVVAMLALGGKGVISVMSNVVPKETHDMCQKWFDGDIAGSRDMQIHLMALEKAMFSDVNPIPVKQAMNMMGMGVGPCRLPLCDMDEKGTEALRNVLKKYDLL